MQLVPGADPVFSRLGEKTAEIFDGGAFLITADQSVGQPSMQAGLYILLIHQFIQIRPHLFDSIDLAQHSQKNICIQFPVLRFNMSPNALKDIFSVEPATGIQVIVCQPNCQIDIIWPDGSAERFPGTDANRLLVLKRGECETL